MNGHRHPATRHGDCSAGSPLIGVRHSCSHKWWACRTTRQPWFSTVLSARSGRGCRGLGSSSLTKLLPQRLAERNQSLSFGRVIAGRVTGGTVITGTVTGGTVITGTVMGGIGSTGTVRGGTLTGGRVTGGRLIGGSTIGGMPIDGTLTVGVVTAGTVIVGVTTVGADVVVAPEVVVGAVPSGTAVPVAGVSPFESGFTDGSMSTDRCVTAVVLAGAPGSSDRVSSPAAVSTVPTTLGSCSTTRGRSCGRGTMFSE